MAPLDDYSIQIRNWHKRYKLSETVMGLFKTLGEHNRGVGDPGALGRLMRMSPGMRKALTDTISQLAKTMHKKADPFTLSECTELIQGCTEILSFANEPAADTRFTLMKLPAEIRRRVYQQYFNNLFANQEKKMIIAPRKTVSGCNCMPHDKTSAWAIDLKLARTSKTVKAEVLACWFESQTFHFACGCELKWHLSRNESLHSNLKDLRVHWTGPMSDAAFKLLAQVPRLRSLVIVISKSTTNVLSARERDLLRYFTHKGQPRLTDALGFDELLQLQGLQSVQVLHVDRVQAHRRTNEERANLEACLRRKIRGQKP